MIFEGTRPSVMTPNNPKTRQNAQRADKQRKTSAPKNFARGISQTAQTCERTFFSGRHVPYRGSNGKNFPFETLFCLKVRFLDFQRWK